MSQEKSSDTHRQPVTEKHSWNGVAKLRPQPPRLLRQLLNLVPNLTNPSATSTGVRGLAADGLIGAVVTDAA
jgi:hypothetical protein